MDPLRDWHEYVDRLSRRSRRLHGAEREARWRPWLDEQAPEPDEHLTPSELPDLSSAIGFPGFSAPRVQPRSVYEDLTVHDSLKPMPEFEVPNLRPPGFELPIPRLAGAKSPSPPALDEAPEPPSHADEPAGETGEPGLGTPGPAAGAGLSVPLSKRLELLERIRAKSGPEPGGPRPGETREELAQRVLDPTLTLEQTAALLGVCPTTVRRYTNRGLLRHFRTQGNQRRFRLSDVWEFMESRSGEIEADAEADRDAGRR